MLEMIISSLSVILAYFFFKPYMKSKQQRLRALRLTLILFFLAIIAHCLINYFAFNKPESFESGVELLKNSKAIESKIGNFESYSYFDEDLPKNNNNPASFKVSLKGPKATIYLSCRIKKDTLGKWHLIEAKQDSLVK